MNNPTSEQNSDREIAELRKELQVAIQDIMSTGNIKLPKEERLRLQDEFAELDKLLEAIETGLVHLVVFGKTSVGKSAVINSILEKDEAEVGIQHDVTTIAIPYKRKPWKLIDLPGIMGSPDFERDAIREARSAHGHIFVLEGEPFADELEQFDKIQEVLPNTPKIAFVNKWDKVESFTPEKDINILKSRITKKMLKYIKSEDNIIYGSSQLFDRENQQMVRQSIPQLMDKLYAEVGTLGQVINILDPAKRTHDLVGEMGEKILATRIRATRRIIFWSAIGSAATGPIPFDALLIAPGMLATMTYAIVKLVSRKPIDKESAEKITKELLKTCGKFLVAEFVFVTAASTAMDTLNVFSFGIFAPLFLTVDVAVLGYYKCRRTVILGEVVIEYTRRDFSWGVDGPEKVIKECKQRAESLYKDLYLNYSR